MRAVPESASMWLMPGNLIRPWHFLAVYNGFVIARPFVIPRSDRIVYARTRQLTPYVIVVSLFFLSDSVAPTHPVGTPSVNDTKDTTMEQRNATLAVRLILDSTSPPSEHTAATNMSLRTLVRLLAREAAREFVEREGNAQDDMTEQ